MDIRQVTPEQAATLAVRALGLGSASVDLFGPRPSPSRCGAQPPSCARHLAGASSTPCVTTMDSWISPIGGDHDGGWQYRVPAILAKHFLDIIGGRATPPRALS